MFESDYSSQLPVLGWSEADLSIITMAPTVTRLSGEEHGEPSASGSTEQAKLVKSAPAVHRGKRVGDGEGRAQGGQFPCEPSVSHVPARLIKAVTTSRAV